jgi:hypothetical protein
MGIKRVYVPHNSAPGAAYGDMQVIGARTLFDVFEKVF